MKFREGPKAVNTLVSCIQMDVGVPSRVHEAPRAQSNLAYLGTGPALSWPKTTRSDVHRSSYRGAGLAHMPSAAQSLKKVGVGDGRLLSPTMFLLKGEYTLRQKVIHSPIDFVYHFDKPDCANAHFDLLGWKCGYHPLLAGLKAGPR